MKFNFKKLHIFTLTVLIPTFIAVIYYSLICTPRYVSESTFSIRTSQSNGSDLLQSLTGLPSNKTGSTAEDNYAIAELLHSHTLISRLPNHLSIRTLFNNDNIDFLSRLTSAKQNEITKYWRKRVHINVDSLSNLSTLSIQAYSAEEAKTLNEFLLRESEMFINELSNRIQNDAAEQAKKELSLSEGRLAKANNALNTFLNTNGEIDPSKSISARGEILASLEAQLAAKQTEFSAKRAFLKQNSPILTTLKGEISALKKQIHKQGQLLQGSSTKTTELLTQYQNLLLEKEFAQQAYGAALASTEKARIEASTQKRYLVRIIEPNLPDETTEPRALMNILTVALFTFLLWGIGSLLIATVRDHIGAI